MVHVHGFGISGTYLEPTAALLASHYRIVEVATTFPDRIQRAVLVSPAGGPNNQPLGRAIGQMAMDGLREPPSMLPIATRDYLRFGVLRSLSLFRAMTRYPTLERLHHLVVPTLVVAGVRDPLVRIANAPRLAVLPHVDAVRIPGAHALNYSDPQLIAELIEAHIAGEPLVTQAGPRSVVAAVSVDGN
jgi:pimeloyl-ACP methyl ester carboxylesterase